MKSKKIGYMFFGKSLFFPEEGILAIGDLHLGYERAIEESGILVPEEQVKELKKEFTKLFEDIELKGYKIKKIVFIGDLKHSFSYSHKEKNYFKDILNFLKNKFKDKDILLIKGNHDTIDYSFSDKLKNYIILKGIAFTHGNKLFEEVFDKKIKIIVLGHLHPSVIISDKHKIKKEKYKCFLEGKFKGKIVVVLPSFLKTIEGTTVNKLDLDYEDYFSFIPRKNLLNFKIHAVGDNETFDFGKVRNLI